MDRPLWDARFMVTFLAARIHKGLMPPCLYIQQTASFYFTNSIASLTFCAGRNSTLFLFYISL
jgi:hypothetical protein